jgi:hypothetical protein
VRRLIGRDIDLMLPVLDVRAELVGHVLVQGAAHGHVQHLDSTANAEQREVTVKRALREPNFGLIAIGQNVVRLRMNLGVTESGRIDICSAGQD